ncbi:hypothetical protein FOCC_FOCC007889 [Frankliniella occidentalis]|nr:hypothetical protein FOCC_FOCC007889 [Frankliniella occidentalis]
MNDYFSHFQIMWTRNIRMFSSFVKSHTLSDKRIKLVHNNKCGYPYAITEDQKLFITEGNPETNRKLQELLMFLYLKHERGDTLPKSITVLELTDLLNLSNTEVESKLQMYERRREKLFTNANVTKNLYVRPKSRVEKRTRGTGSIHDEPVRNSMFLPIIPRSQSLFYNINLGKGLSFGQQVVFDCSYDSYMSSAQLRETAKEDIVYVSPHVSRELEYHPDDIYVIGALNRSEEKLALKKARLEGIRCARLPLNFRQLKRRNYVPSLWEMFERLLIEKNS